MKGALEERLVHISQGELEWKLKGHNFQERKIELEEKSYSKER
jgi:hypothetical protein